MQVITARPSIILHLLIVFSLLIGLPAVAADAKPELKPFTLVIKDPLKSMPDYSTISHIPARKDAFFKALLPLVLYENQRITWQREQLIAANEQVKQGKTLSAKDLKKVTEISSYYGLEWPLEEKDWAVVANKIQPVPADLVLMQAANESAWGTSRFAREGNNLFGQWCFSKGCGLVPSGRDKGKSHEVRKFATVLESVQAYMVNINTHRAYADLRDIRQSLNKSNKKVGGIDLAPGLLSYSERRQAYVDELVQMIRTNAKYVDKAMTEVGVHFLNQ